MPTVTKLTKADEIRNARQAFEDNVTTKVYDEFFSSIGQGFKVMSMIGNKNIYVKCEAEGRVVGMAYGYDKGGGTFYIQDIISKAGSNSGTAMVDWFGELEGIRTLELTAANATLQGTYAKPHYGFTLENKDTGKMTKMV